MSEHRIEVLRDEKPIWRIEVTRLGLDCSLGTGIDRKAGQLYVRNDEHRRKTVSTLNWELGQAHGDEFHCE